MEIRVIGKVEEFAALAKAIQERQESKDRMFFDLMQNLGVDVTRLEESCETQGATGEDSREKEYHQIIVVDSEHEVLAVITDDSVVERDGYHVILI
jgi:hypothetical protein